MAGVKLTKAGIPYKDTRGGARKGSGRPKKTTNKRNRSFYLSDEVYEEIKQRGGASYVSKVVMLLK